MENLQEIWQVSVNNQIYDASLEEMREWIGEGALLPLDKVRRGNLRWLEAGKVPLLFGFFNAKELGLPMPFAQTTTDAKGNVEAERETANDSNVDDSPAPPNELGFSSVAVESAPAQTNNFETAPQIPKAEIRFDAPAADACFVHPQSSPAFVCGGCGNFFCKACPQSFGSTVKICPLCGAMCKPFAEAKSKRENAVRHQFAVSEGFGFEDVGRALAYPFRYKTSFIFGAVMFMFFTLGQSASAVGGMFMMFAAIFCYMLANTLTFGILANTVENFTRGETDKNFMPDFDDFNLWDDVVHPFFLSVAAYLVSFGLLAALIVGAAWYAMKHLPAQPFSTPQNLSAKTGGAKNPAVNGAPLQNIKVGNQTIAVERRETSSYAPAVASVDGDGVEKMQQLVENQHRAEMEAIAGKSPETKEKEYAQMVQSLAGFMIPLALLAFVATLWGVFYFPAACCVAGYTRSFTATINPLVGLDTIRRLGLDYAKIFGIFIVIGIASLVVSAILAVVFSPLDLPQMGNLPAKAIGSFAAFYFSIVFSVNLGFALYKNSGRLDLYRG